MSNTPTFYLTSPARARALGLAPAPIGAGLSWPNALLHVWPAPAPVELEPGELAQLYTSGVCASALVLVDPDEHPKAVAALLRELADALDGADDGAAADPLTQLRALAAPKRSTRSDDGERAISSRRAETMSALVAGKMERPGA